MRKQSLHTMAPGLYKIATRKHRTMEEFYEENRIRSAARLHSPAQLLQFNCPLDVAPLDYVESETRGHHHLELDRQRHLILRFGIHNSVSGLLPPSSPQPRFGRRTQSRSASYSHDPCSTGRSLLPTCSSGVGCKTHDVHSAWGYKRRPTSARTTLSLSQFAPTPISRLVGEALVTNLTPPQPWGLELVGHVHRF